MMITKDDLKLWREATGEIDGLSHETLQALCDLALAGLAVQWRPIEGAPPAQAECQVLVKHKNGEIRLCNSDGDFWRYVLSKQPGFYIKSFIPLSALPTPGGQS